jgi:hypothetical protein
MLAIDWKWIRIGELTSPNLVIYCNLAWLYKYNWVRLPHRNIFVCHYILTKYVNS